MDETRPIIWFYPSFGTLSMKYEQVHILHSGEYQSRWMGFAPSTYQYALLFLLTGELLTGPRPRSNRRSSFVFRSLFPEGRRSGKSPNFWLLICSFVRNVDVTFHFDDTFNYCQMNEKTLRFWTSKMYFPKTLRLC